MKNYINSAITYFIAFFVIANYSIINIFEVDNIIMLLIILLMVLNLQQFLNSIIKHLKITITFFLIVIYWTVNFVLNTNIRFDDLRYVIIVFLLFNLYQKIIKDINIYRLFFSMGIIAQIVATHNLVSIDRYTIFFLDTREYFEVFNKKNGIGPILSVFGIFYLYDLFFMSRKKINIIFFIYILNAIILFHTRSSIVGIIIVAIFLIYKFFTKNKYVNFYFKVFIPVFFILITLFNFNRIRSFIRNLTFDYLNELSSFRFNDYLIGLNYFVENPLLGNMFKINYLNLYEVDVHNLWMRTLFNGGLVYFIIFLLFAICIFKTIQKGTHNLYLKNSLLIYGLVISFLEMFAPFGTGTTYFFYWILIIRILQHPINKE